MICLNEIFFFIALSQISEIAWFEIFDMLEMKCLFRSELID